MAKLLVYPGDWGGWSAGNQGAADIVKIGILTPDPDGFIIFVLLSLYAWK